MIQIPKKGLHCREFSRQFFYQEIFFLFFIYRQKILWFWINQIGMVRAQFSFVLSNSMIQKHLL